MTDDDENILDQIAKEVGTITEELEADSRVDSPDEDKEEDAVDLDKRNMNEYDGGW